MAERSNSESLRESDLPGVVLIGLLLAAVGALLWALRNTAGVGEWLRSVSDIPTNAVLLGTSGFESDGHDPAKARP